jgi:hypothetical protein
VSDSSVPDSVSPEALRSFLSRGANLPESELVPELNLGGSMGAPCDLQFVISQVIARSSTGTNIVQMLCAGMHLLTEVEAHFEDQLERLALEEDPFEGLSGSEQKSCGVLLRRNLVALRTSLHALEELLSGLTMAFYQARAHDLQHGALQDKRFSLEEFRSHMLISDELLASLQLERQAVTAYLNASVPSEP